MKTIEKIADNSDDKLIREGSKDLLNVINNIRLLKNTIVKEKRYDTAAEIRDIERTMWADIAIATSKACSRATRVEWPVEDNDQILTMEEEHGLPEVMPPKEED